MSKKPTVTVPDEYIDYKFDIPLLTEEAASIWEDMPAIIRGVVAGKQEAIEQFSRLDTLVNGGELRKVGTAFGQDIYARINTNDPDMADYQAKRLAAMMSNFISSETEEVTIGGATYTVVLKEPKS